MMKERIINGRIQYIKRIHEGNNNLLKRILEEMIRMRNTQWTNTTLKYMQEIHVKFIDVITLNKNKLKEKTKDWDTKLWKQELQTKTTLHIYKNFKKSIKKEQIYDNCESSIILYRARANCLPFNDRKRHTGEDTSCKICRQGSGSETLERFMLMCPVLSEERVKSTILLQQPFQEDNATTIAEFLFQAQDMMEKKKMLYQMWKKRREKINQLNP